jgi:hypothetical protein
MIHTVLQDLALSNHKEGLFVFLPLSQQSAEEIFSYVAMSFLPNFHQDKRRSKA